MAPDAPIAQTSSGERPRGWRVWIDRGGTFTDVVARPPQGPLQVRKVLSVQPEREGDPAVRAIRELLDLAEGEAWPPGLLEEVRLGTTVATNALLEHASEPVLLLVATGLADLLRIGDQHRPDLFALRIERPQPLDVRVLEVEGRLGATGEEVAPLVLDAALEQRIREALAEGPRRLAVALPHSWRNPAHEQALGAWLAARGLGPALLSHALSRQPRLLPRAATTVVEAALEPVLRRYLARVEAALTPERHTPERHTPEDHTPQGPRPPLRVMTSSGTLCRPALLRAKDTILSGPAGGMVGAMAAARQAGWGDAPLLGFDMGGTSTDVFHLASARGELARERLSGMEVAGLPLLADRLPIHTVAAGGGSVLRAVEGRLVVGPRSAGADPGPACYRRGGPATITDANLLLGRLPLDALPAVFGPAGDQPADRRAAERRLQELGEALALTPEQVALGALRVAVERMAEAIRSISIQRGHDIRQAVLVSYGGAGGQHACALARRLGVRRVVLHPLAGVLSAWGIGLAPRELHRERSLRLPLAPDADGPLRECVAAMEAEGRRALVEAGDLEPGETPGLTLRLDLRTAASEQVLELDGAPLLAASGAAWVEVLRRDFVALHARRFGHRPGDEALVVERVVVSVRAPEKEAAEIGETGGAGPGHVNNAAEATLPLCVADPQTPPGAPTQPLWLSVPQWRRSQLQPGQRLSGPAVVVEDTGTLVLEPGWSARVLPGGTLVLEAPPADDDRTALADPTSARTPASGDPASGDPGRPDPVRLELYNNRFSAIAEQMGVRLRQSSRSVNIRERLDFSCALFDRHGRLVANAPHIPVHLGAMGESVVALLEACACGERPPLRPGDVIASNNPFNGGTHLPDVTVITPVFAQAGAGEGGNRGDDARDEDREEDREEDRDDSDDGADDDRNASDDDRRYGDRPVAELVAFVANRGHHADVGGLTPGSMPAFSRTIAEEGLLLDNVPLLENGRWPEAAWLERCAAGPWPVRDPLRFLADLRAQMAANQLGVEELTQLLAREGQTEVLAYMAHSQRQAAEAVRNVIPRLRDGARTLELDNGARIVVAVRVDRSARCVRVDFSGTSPQRDDNMNAPLAITKAAVMYVFRTLVEEPLPLNAGCFDPIELVVPRGSLLWPQPPAAVVAGNVETSQAVANALYGALGVLAAGQGTMNNLSFGDGARQYYETICGGAGAGWDRDGSGFAGASAVQTHMTNSRLTDVEILEDRFPVRVERFAIRQSSGGAGRWRGGDGVERWLRFLAPQTVCLLSSSRRVPPFALAGGQPGATGQNAVRRLDGTWQPLPGCAQVEMAAGEVLRIATPGGGGAGISHRPHGGESLVPEQRTADSAAPMAP